MIVIRQGVQAMAKGYFIRKGDKTTCGGEVLDADTRVMMFGFAHARAGDPVSCGKNDETYEIEGGIAFFGSHGGLVAGSLDSRSGCPCKAGLVPSFTTATYESRQGAAPPAARSAPQQEATPVAPSNPVTPRQSSFTSARAPSPTLSERPGTACENHWRGYQQRVENVVAPNGKLIADPKARNKAINAAYAQLWRHDPRFPGRAGGLRLETGGLWIAARGRHDRESSGGRGNDIATEGQRQTRIERFAQPQ
ncbi:PAAR domain-containing protein [Pseudomonas umsongensis]